MILPACIVKAAWALSENSIVGPRASVFSPGKDGEAGDIGFIVDAAGCSQAENKPLEARSSFLTEPSSNRIPPSRKASFLQRSRKGFFLWSIALVETRFTA
jgi:hypothetical protein